MFSKHALLWHTSQLKTYQLHQNNSKFNLLFFDKHISPSYWLFWDALYHGAASTTELTVKITQACDSEQFACGAFLDLQKAFDTVKHNIFLREQDCYGKRGVSNI